ncbi:hypothetical protein [Pseudorhodobacter sp.]|uniref:hypothetical protein n=1 Tax=Pseudorhodobacter sp. TaxID=1934400 RepID=UPI002AFF8BAE|nr:hypothetical protein [Pseudorhodobacter sp.]
MTERKNWVEVLRGMGAACGLMISGFDLKTIAVALAVTEISVFAFVGHRGAFGLGPCNRRTCTLSGLRHD